MTSFGNMTDRPAVIVRLDSMDGAIGWGEVWCNYPTCGAEHRARLIESVFKPLLVGFEFEQPEEVFAHLTTRTHVLAIQTAEVGPIAQCIAGLDIAAWDLAARADGVSLFRYLGGDRTEIPAYASGINPIGAPESIERARKSGYRTFKVKIGFNQYEDIAILEEIRDGLGDSEEMMADANQAWNIDAAVEFVQKAQDIPLAWLEEPIPADRSHEEWQTIAKQSPIPIGAGENIRGDDFRVKIKHGYLEVLQPDICKWGGISGNLPIVKAILESGKRYCPHYLGGGIGLIASAHLLAAVGGDGALEVDFNDNLLREGLAQPYPAFADGIFRLSDSPGLGVEPDQGLVAELHVAHDYS